MRKWQAEMLTKGYSDTYLRSVYNQLNAIFNYAVRFYDLSDNPCRKAGSIGRKNADEMQYWVKEEFDKFILAVSDKPVSKIIFTTLFWTGLREGELLALTPADIDFNKCTLRVNKSYQRIEKKDVITPPKTPKSKRVISIPQFLADELKAYINSIYGIKKTHRIFPFTKHYLTKEMTRGCEKSGVKKIRIHDLRHPYVKPTTKNNCEN
ncbi:MAG: site-specific integrase [Lachnospiraceae bacterium]|nr:site-specific integrase [Lachnospiraceae bacterium]